MHHRVMAAVATFAALAATNAPASGQELRALGQGPVVVVAPAPAQQSPAVAAPSATPVVRTGKLVMNIAIAIVSNIPTTTPIVCQFSPAVSGLNATTSVYDMLMETGAVRATRTGATATCTVEVPYSWQLYAVSTDIVTPNYMVTATDAQGIGRTAGTPTYLVAGSTMNVNGGFPVPANGVVKTLARSVRL